MTAQTNDQRTGADLTPFTQAVLDLSTAHIPRRTAVALGDEGDCKQAELWDYLSYTPWHEYGWLIYTDGYSLIEKEHPELAALLQFASDHGFTFLRLDCDADVYDGLPTFDWE